MEKENWKTFKGYLVTKNFATFSKDYQNLTITIYPKISCSKFFLISHETVKFQWQASNNFPTWYAGKVSIETDNVETLKLATKILNAVQNTFSNNPLSVIQYLETHGYKYVNLYDTGGTVLFFPIEKWPQNPCWFVREKDSRQVIEYVFAANKYSALDIARQTAYYDPNKEYIIELASDQKNWTSLDLSIANWPTLSRFNNIA